MAENRFQKYAQPQNRFSKYAADGAPAPQQERSWYDVPMEALSNTPESALNFGKAIAQPFMHPVDTYNSMNDLLAGAVGKIPGMKAGNAWLADMGIAERIPKETLKRQEATADAVGGFYKDRYGSMEGLKNTLATDPVGALADVSTVLTGGASGATRALGQTSKIARALDTTARVTNPLVVPEKALAATQWAGSPIIKALLGATTGTSSDTIGEAYKAARTGGEQLKAYLANLRGHEDQSAVIGEARDAIGNIADARRAQYQKDMAAIGQDKTPIDMRPIADRFNKVIDSVYHNGHQVGSKETISKLREIQKVLAEWAADPAVHDAAGLDALKKRVDSLMPSFTEAGNAERVVTEVRTAIKDAIVSQAPEYAKAMEGYETSKVAQREIERSLSLGKNASADSTLRKMQSLTRNNANTNYGGRMNNAKLLEDAGAKTLMPRLAGQALNTALPRGILKALLGGGAVIGAGAGVVSPAVLAALPLASPRLVGEATRIAGASARRLNALPKPTKTQLLIARLLGGSAMTGSQSQGQ